MIDSGASDLEAKLTALQGELKAMHKVRLLFYFHKSMGRYDIEILFTITNADTELVAQQVGVERQNATKRGAPVARSARDSSPGLGRIREADSGPRRTCSGRFDFEPIYSQKYFVSRRHGADATSSSKRTTNVRKTEIKNGYLFVFPFPILNLTQSD